MKLRTVIATATTAAVLASSGVAIAGATASTDAHSAPVAQTAPAATATPAAPPSLTHKWEIRRLRLRALLRGAGGVVTKTIGIDRKTLRQGLRSGMTIAEIATAHTVSLQTVIDALVAAADKKLESALTAGKIRAELAARIEQRLPARIAKLVNSWHPKWVRSHAAA
jgi:hypothetical protein